MLKLYYFQGHCMKLVYFLSQYDLLDPVTKVSRPVSESLNDGHSVTVCMEGSSAHRLQTTTLVSTGKGCVHIHQYQLLGVRMSRGVRIVKNQIRIWTSSIGFVGWERIEYLSSHLCVFFCLTLIQIINGPDFWRLDCRQSTVFEIQCL